MQTAVMLKSQNLFSKVSKEEAEQIVSAARIRDELEALLWTLEPGEAIKTSLPLRVIAPKVYNWGKAKRRKFRVETRDQQVYIARLA